nr:polysaccharide biosynthesis C-terminal domain-containing protein [Lachnospiraceae bacterium]
AWTMGLLTVLFSVIGYIGSPLFLRLLRVPDDCIGYGITYLKIIFAFTGGTMLFNFASSILRSTGDSRTPLYALVVASLANIALDLLLILGAGFGVRGAAIATVISQFVSGILCMGAIIRNRAAFGFDTDTGWLPDVASIRLVVTTSIPATFQSCMISIGGIFVQRLINSFGAATLAGYIAASKVDSLAIQVILSVGNALCVFTGQNIGSNRIDRVKTALKQSQLIMLASAVVIATCAYLFRFRVMGLFLNADTEPEAIVIGATYLSIMGVAYLICAIMQSYQNVIRGAGDVTVCMIAGLTELGGRILFAYLLSPLFGSTGIWIATPISWACGCIIPVIRYYSGKWEARRL